MHVSGERIAQELAVPMIQYELIAWACERSDSGRDKRPHLVYQDDKQCSKFGRTASPSQP